MEKIFQGRTEQEAIEKAVQEFGVSPEVVDVEILKRSKGSIFGLQGTVTIRASITGFPDSDADEEHEEIKRSVSEYDESDINDDIVLTDEIKSAIENFVKTITKSLNVHVNRIDMNNGSSVKIDIEDECDQNLLIGKFEKI